MSEVKEWQYEQRKAFPLELKILLSEIRIREWYIRWRGNVYVSFSGGKDSTVLLHIVRGLFPEVPAVFVDTGLEYPEVRELVESTENVTWIKPKHSFSQVIKRYGYPVISKEQACALARYRGTNDPVQKHRRLNGWPKGKKGMISQKWQFLINAPFLISDRCCDLLKKDPLDRYARETGRKPLTGMMATESRNRKLQYLKQGCNAFGNKKPVSWPLAFWGEEDIWRYITKFNVPYSRIYDKGYERTGCMFCMFGVHLEGTPNRFQRMKRTHPGHYDYCMNKLGCKKVLDFIGVCSE